MSTDIRPEVSTKRPYWISKHHYYELKHYCLQYSEWEKQYEELEARTSSSMVNYISRDRSFQDPVGNVAVLKAYYSEKMEQIKRIAKEADPDLAKYILMAVTMPASYTYLKYREGMPCSKDMFYDRYRKFFWLLARARR